jgi:hypothetical protein
MCEHGFRALPIFVVVENLFDGGHWRRRADSNRCIEVKVAKSSSDTE